MNGYFQAGIERRVCPLSMEMEASFERSREALFRMREMFYFARNLSPGKGKPFWSGVVG